MRNLNSLPLPEVEMEIELPEDFPADISCLQLLEEIEVKNVEEQQKIEIAPTTIITSLKEFDYFSDIGDKKNVDVDIDIIEEVETQDYSSPIELNLEPAAEEGSPLDLCIIPEESLEIKERNHSFSVDESLNKEWIPEKVKKRKAIPLQKAVEKKNFVSKIEDLFH